MSLSKELAAKPFSEITAHSPRLQYNTNTNRAYKLTQVVFIINSYQIAMHKIQKV